MRKKRRDNNGELLAFLGGDRVEIDKVLRAIQPTDDTELAVLAVHQVLGKDFLLASHARRLPVAVIRGVLARRSSHPTYTFLRLAVPDDASDEVVATCWTNALQALLDLASEDAWTSPERRAIVERLAGDPRLLAAIQGTVANTPNVSIDMLAVLVADGGDASYDALIPHIDPALVGADARLDRLMRLATHAKRTPLLDTLFAELADAREHRGARSPALVLGPLIGIGNVDPLWFTCWLRGRTAARYRHRVEARIDVDSRKPSWFVVVVTANSYTSFDALGSVTDQLEIGTCDLFELPAWLATIATKLKLVSSSVAFWSVADLRTALTREQRDRVTGWLVGS
jgi:hypothetical protein